MPNSSPEQTALRLHDLVADALRHGRRELVLPRGDYIVSGGWLPDRQLWISNNDSGIKPILFDLAGAEDFTLDGNGSTLRVLGVLIPVLLQQCSRVTVRNLTIDWVRPGFTEAEVVAHCARGFEFVTPPGGDTFHVVAGRLTASGGGSWPSGHLYNVLAFDRALREPLARSTESWQIERTHLATDLGAGRFRIEADFERLPPAGGPVVFMHGDRVAPAVVADASDDARIEEVTIHHALGMGVVAQACRRITLRKVRVVPSGERLFSTWVDALHTVDCGDRILVEDCELRGMFDDGANLHGAHRRVAFWRAPDRVVVEAMHHQQVGVLYTRSDDTVHFADPATLAPRCEARVVAVRRLNSRLQELLLDRPYPALEAEPLIVRRWEPGLLTLVRGCSIGPNRGRGLLLSTPGRIVVENNRLHTSGNAIEMPTDAGYWWESGPVQEVRIAGNTFEACGFAMCGRHLLVVSAPEGPQILHGSVEFTGNTCTLAGSGVAIAQRLGRLKLRGNTFSRSATYPWSADDPALDLRQVATCDVEPLPACVAAPAPA